MQRGLRWLAAIALLPGNALVVIPGLILAVTRATAWKPELQAPPAWGFWLGLAIGASALTLASWTAYLFLRFGDGTPAPWDPPKKFVVRGPYRHLRNPMISAVILALAAESILFASWPLLAWGVIFALGNAIYIPLIEEPRLLRRFGADYETYRQQVPRWVPRLHGWSPDSADAR